MESVIIKQRIKRKMKKIPQHKLNVEEFYNKKNKKKMEGEIQMKLRTQCGCR